MSLKNASKAGKKSFHDLNVSFGPPNSAKPAEEVPPRLNCLFSPHPEARHRSNDEDHEILDHVHREVRFGHRRRGVGRTGNLPFSSILRVLTQVLLPLDHPGGEVVLLIEQAGYDDGHGDSVEHREHPNPNDQLFQLVSLGTVLLHYSPDLDEREETKDEEGCADGEVDDEGGENEPSQT